jgi:uncharacterized membrane protein HdeD (DUF308 family)
MKQKTLAGILLIVVGAAVLIYPNIPYKKEENSVDMGPMHVKVEEQKKVTISPVIGGLIILGGIVLVVLGVPRSQ